MPWTPRSSRSRYRTPAAWRPTSHSSSPPSSPCSSRPGSRACSPPSSTPRNATLAALHADLTRRRREPLLIVLNRARDRGQVPPDLDPEITTDLLAGPFFYRRFIAHRPIPPDLAHDVIANGLTTDQSTAAGTSAGPTRSMHRRSSR